MRPERVVDRPIDSSRAQFSALGLGDLVGFLVRVVLPTWAKGILLRRPIAVALAAKLDLDRKAVRFLQYLRKKYGAGPLLLPNPIRTQLLLLAERDVRRVLAEAPEPFTPASTEKQAALSHFEPHNSLITRGPQRGPRRQFHDEVLQSSQPCMIALKHFWPWCGAKRGAVTQWLFAFDAGAIMTFRALALLLAHPVSFANAEPTLQHGAEEAPIFLTCAPLSLKQSGCIPRCPPYYARPRRLRIGKGGRWTRAQASSSTFRFSTAIRIGFRMLIASPLASG